MIGIFLMWVGEQSPALVLISAMASLSGAWLTMETLK